MLWSQEEVFEFSEGKVLEILITPIVIKSDKNLLALELSERKCYFEGERKLQFFKVKSVEHE